MISSLLRSIESLQHILLAPWVELQESLHLRCSRHELEHHVLCRKEEPKNSYLLLDCQRKICGNNLREAPPLTKSYRFYFNETLFQLKCLILNKTSSCGVGYTQVFSSYYFNFLPFRSLAFNPESRT